MAGVYVRPEQDMDIVEDVLVALETIILERFSGALLLPRIFNAKTQGLIKGYNSTGMVIKKLVHPTWRKNEGSRKVHC